MRKFIIEILKFLFLPLFIGFFLVLYAEITLYNYPSTFQLKSEYIKNNIDKINVLVLGSSHNQNAINPELIDNVNISNLAFGGQTLKIDSTLLRKYINILNLKMVIFELSYHTLEHAYSSKYHRNSLYLRFYDVNLFNRRVSPIDYSIYFSNPELYNKFLNPWTVKTSINKYGFATELSSHDQEQQRFKNLNYNEQEIMRDSSNMFILRHKYENVIAFKSNTKRMSEMIGLCKKNNIIPIIMMPPVFKNYFDSYLFDKEQRRKTFVKFIKEKFPTTIVLDYEQNRSFKVTDFKNEDHLNPEGAEKLSLKLDSIFNTMGYKNFVIKDR